MPYGKSENRNQQCKSQTGLKYRPRPPDKLELIRLRTARRTEQYEDKSIQPPDYRGKATYMTDTKPSPSHQDLLREFYDLHLSEIQGLNLLSRHHIISDHASFAHQIARADLARAIHFLKTGEKI